MSDSNILLQSDTDKADSQQDTPMNLVCPRCACRHFYLLSSKPLSNGRVRERKVCRYCGRQVTVVEAKNFSS